MVPRDKQTLLMGVPQRKGKNAVESVRAVVAPLFVGMNDHFCIRARLELVPLRQKFFSELNKVVDLAIEDDLNTAVLVGLRLPAAIEVNDAETPIREPYRAANVKSLAVRPSVADSFVHPLQETAVSS